MLTQAPAFVFPSLADAYIKNRSFATGWLTSMGGASLEILSRREETLTLVDPVVRVGVGQRQRRSCKRLGTLR
jgi:hypothetical protein